MKRSSNEIHQSVVRVLSERYAPPLIDNSDRGKYVEAMVAEILGAEWELTSKMSGHSAWSMWDIEHRTTGKKIEVKQSAACQTWLPSDKGSAKKSIATNPRFDIKEVESILGR